MLWSLLAQLLCEIGACARNLSVDSRHPAVIETELKPEARRMSVCINALKNSLLD